MNIAVRRSAGNNKSKGAYFMSKRKVSVEDKIYAVNLYLDGKESQRRIADMFDVSLASVQQWIRNYESMGANAFTLKGNKKYSKELKQQAVLDYLAGYGSQDDISILTTGAQDRLQTLSI